MLAALHLKMVDSPEINNKNNLEEKLREAACIGDILEVRELILRGVNVNSKNEINGWTALHWAAHRGHGSIVEVLLCNGADKAIINSKGETPSTLSKNQSCVNLLGVSPVKKCEAKLPITPSYLKHPPLPDKLPITDFPAMISSSYSSSGSATEEIVLKVRIANCGDPDFIEIELNKSELTFSRLVKTCCEELNTSANQILRLRKLPNTIIRKDKDVQRLKDYQELELVLSTPSTPSTNSVLLSSPISPSVNGNGYESIYLRKNQTILY